METLPFTSITDPQLHQSVTQEERSHMIRNFFDYRTEAPPEVHESMVNSTFQPTTTSGVDATISQVLTNVYQYVGEEANQGLEEKQREINARDVILQTTHDETSNLYLAIYTILVGIFVAVLISAVTAAKTIIGERLYRVLFWILIISYVIYVIYIYDLFFVKDSIQQILNYIKYGRIEIGKVDLTVRLENGSSYAQRQCAMKKAEEDKNKPMVVTKEDDEGPVANPSAFITDFTRPNGSSEADHVYYRDTHSTIQRVYPTTTGSQNVYYPDQNNRVLYQTPTSRL